MKSDACCPLHAVVRAFFHVVACRPLRVACRLLFAAYCPLHGACRLDVVYHAVCRLLHIPHCMLQVVYFLFAHFPVVPCTLPLACRLRHCCQSDRACCALSVICFRLPAPVPHGVRCPLPVPRRISSSTCSALRVVCCLLHDARSQSHVVSCPLRVPSCMPSVACCTVDSQRRRARSASLRTHGYSQSHTVTLATHTHASTPRSAAGLADH